MDTIRQHVAGGVPDMFEALLFISLYLFDVMCLIVVWKSFFSMPECGGENNCFLSFSDS